MEPRTPTGKGLAAGLRALPTTRDDSEWPERLIVKVENEAYEQGAREERTKLMALLSLSDGDPDHAPGPGYLSDRRALFLLGWHERAQAFRQVVDFSDMPMSTHVDEPTDAP
jgi:hypothetical protein